MFYRSAINHGVRIGMAVKENKTIKPLSRAGHHEVSQVTLDEDETQ